MDLNSVSDIVMLLRDDAMPSWRAGDRWLAGGTWLFSEPQPDVHRLVDLTALPWKPAHRDDDGVEVAATCTIAQLAAFAAAASFPAATLITQCCRSLLGSFKVWNMATVGGNICMALPAGPMTALFSALDAVGTVWDGADEARVRHVRISDLVVGPRATVLAPSDLLRAIHVPPAMLDARTAFRRVSLNPLGRTGALVIGTCDGDDAFALTVTGSTLRPIRLTFPAIPEAMVLHARIEEAVPAGAWYDDVHGAPPWRRHVTLHLAEEIRRELLDGPRA